MKVPSTQTVQMDFPEPGLIEVSRGASCADGHTYSLVTYLRSGPATIGTYCQGGPLSSIQVRYKARMNLVVPGDQTLDTRDFKLSVGPETKSKGISFPDGQQMGWDFRVPGMHNYTVRVHDHRLPEECLSERVQLEYRGADLKVSRPGLGDPQPSHRQGDFNMSLSNCKTNGSLEGLILAFTVAVMRSGHPVLCTVDLTKMADLSLQIQKVGSDPYCEMSADSRVQDGVTVAAGTSARLSFLDCPNEDLRLTASRAVGKQHHHRRSSLLGSIPCWCPHSFYL
ncbi:hypothetical protein CRUP_006304 [Coryphaenoides rupestris]|nr:hypothetical protein CRUP_006304 [Coryphaenoides rupestris]